MYGTVDEIVKIGLSGDPAVSRNVHDKRMALTLQLNLKNCHLLEKNAFTAAISGAQSTLSAASSSLEWTTPDAYETWFGASKSSRKTKVKGNFKAVKKNISTYTYRCGCDSQKERDSVGGIYNGKYTFPLRLLSGR